MRVVGNGGVPRRTIAATDDRVKAGVVAIMSGTTEQGGIASKITIRDSSVEGPVRVREEAVPD